MVFFRLQFFNCEYKLGHNLGKSENWKSTTWNIVNIPLTTDQTRLEFH